MKHFPVKIVGKYGKSVVQAEVKWEERTTIRKGVSAMILTTLPILDEYKEADKELPKSDVCLLSLIASAAH